MKITDVIELFELELAFGAPGSKAMGSANFGLLSRYYTRPSQRMQPTLSLNFGSDNMVKLTGADVETIAKYYDTLPADADRYDFVYDTMSRADKFNALLARLGLRQPLTPIPTANQTSMDLNEVGPEKEPDLSRSGVRSAALNTALRQAYAKYPQAQSDMEALLMYDMDVQKNTSQELKSQDQTNQRQDDVDIQLRDVNRKQSNKIGNLDDENDALSAELDKLSRELDAMTAQTGSAPERRKDSDSVKAPDSDTGPSNYGVNVSSDARADKSQKRSADAEKRKSEPEAPPSQQNLASTVPPYIPPPRPTVGVPTAVNPPLPTINVIDRPDPSAAMSQIAQSLSNPSTSSAIGQTAQNLTNPPAKDSITDPMAPPTRLGAPEPDVDADSAYSAARSAEDEPDNVFKFPGSKKEIPADAGQGSLDFDGEDELARQRQTVAQLRGSGAVKARNAIRDTAAAGMLEAQLRRMKQLAGLPVNEADSFYVPPKPGVFAIRVNAMFIDDFSPRYRPENPEILWNGLSTAFPQDYSRVKFGTPSTPQAEVFAELKNRTISDVKTGLTQDMAETLAERLGKSDPTGQLSRFIQVIKKRS